MDSPDKTWYPCADCGVLTRKHGENKTKVWGYHRKGDKWYKIRCVCKSCYDSRK